MTVPMSNRTIAERIMDQVIDIDAGPAAVLLQAIHEALDLAEKRGFAEAVERAAKECIHKREYCGDTGHDDRWCSNCSSMADALDLCEQRIRALGLGEK